MGWNKKSKPNAFNIFVDELSEKARRRINHSAAQEEWNQLSEGKKDEYREKALAKKQKLGLISGPSPVVNPAVVEYQRKQLEVLHSENMKAEEVKSDVELQEDLGMLDEKVFYIVSIETFYEDASDIFPCEFAMAKFSLRKGIFDELHICIHPGPLPLGAAYSAREKSKNKHKYPVPTESNYNPHVEEQSYILILNKIITFMHPFNEIPKFFVDGHLTGDHALLFSTQRAFQKIFSKACEYQIARDLKVYAVPLSRHFSLPQCEHEQLLFFIKYYQLSVLERAIFNWRGQDCLFNQFKKVCCYLVCTFIHLHGL